MPTIHFITCAATINLEGVQGGNSKAVISFRIDSDPLIKTMEIQQAAGSFEPKMILHDNLDKVLFDKDILEEAMSYVEGCFNLIGIKKTSGNYNIERNQTTWVRTAPESVSAGSNLRLFYGMNNFKVSEKFDFKMHGIKLNLNRAEFTVDERAVFGRVRPEMFPCPWLGLEGDLSELFSFYKVNKIEDFVQLVSNTVESFLIALWFVKDNSVNMGPKFVSYETENWFVESQNFYLNKNSIGLVEDTEFTFAELSLGLKKANDLDRLTSDSIPAEPFAAPRFNETTVTTVLNPISALPYNSHNRFTRAMRFVEVARRSEFLPMKIAFYIGALECVFTTDNTEVTHKVSERTAFFLGGTTDDKLKFFKEVKDAYDVRSNYMHGSLLSNKSKSVEKLKPISFNIDNIVRSVLNKILDSPDMFIKLKEADLADEFLKQIFLKR